MDEPLSNLDAKLRVQMRSEVARIQHELAGHDRLRHARPGRGDDDGRPRRADAPRRAAAGRHADAALQRAGQPVRRELHRHPGDEPLRGAARPAQRPPRRHDRRPAPAPGRDALAKPGDLERYGGRTVALGIRPEHLEDAAVETGAPSEQRLQATVKTVEALGAELIAHLEIAGRPVLDRRGQGGRGRHRQHDGRRARGRGADAKLPLVGRFDVASRAHGPARTSRSWWTRSRVHFFDLDTGAAIGGHPVAGSSDGHHRHRAARHGATRDEARAALRINAETRTALLFLLPSFIGFLVFYAYPALRGFYLSFTDFDLLQQLRRAGSASTTTGRCSRTRCSGTRSGSRSST